MRFIADFHIHSKHSRATSPKMDLENIAKWAKIKGINVIAVGDYTHPEWLKILKEKLEPAEPGLYRLRRQASASEQGVRFILTSEVSCIYSKNGRIRKIHILIFSPSLKIVEKINARLSLIGNLKADGRPVLGLDAKELAKIVLNASENCLIVGAHLMTPWFSLFGSRSGFDSLEECFEDYSRHIYAGETGLSADPAMLWRIPDGRRIALISNSDAHSPQKIGREANVFNAELNYFSIIKAIKRKDPREFLYTIEFYPEEGKYHYDGHRSCQLSLSPAETRRYNGVCPRCGRPLTIGVLNRVEQLADKPVGFQPKEAVPFKSLVPLTEIIAEVFGVGSGTVQVEKEYKKLIKELGSEFNILLAAKREDLEKFTLPEVAEGIIRAREGRVIREPGYDGVYGKIRVFLEKEKKIFSGRQGVLF